MEKHQVHGDKLGKAKFPTGWAAIQGFAVESGVEHGVFNDADTKIALGCNRSFKVINGNEKLSRRTRNAYRSLHHG